MIGSFGIDVSNNNGRLTNIGHPSFVLAKCTEGTSFVDADYGYYAQMAESHKAQFGAYHFFHAEDLSARAQARFFMTHARPRNFGSLWVDYETYGISGSVDAGQIGLFISTIKMSYPHVKVGIYANTVGLKKIQSKLAEIPYDAIWYANPSVPSGAQVSGLPAWQIHQYATTNGVDQDYSVWSETEMQKFFTW